MNRDDEYGQYGWCRLCNLAMPTTHIREHEAEVEAATELAIVDDNADAPIAADKDDTQ